MIWLDNTRILAIFAVVLLHVSGGVIVNSEWGSQAWWIGNIYNGFTRWCVPMFVMLSGALLLDSRKQESLTQFYRKRLSRILWPLLFWSVFFSGWAWARGMVKGEPVHLLTLLNNLLTGKPNDHLWFLFMILGLYLFTPFLRKVVAHSTHQELGFLTGATMAIVAVSYGHQHIWPGAEGVPDLFITWFLLFIPFFLLGYWIRQDSQSFPQWLLWLIFILSGLATVGGYFGLGQWLNPAAGNYVYGYLSITVIPLSVSLMYLLKTWTIPICGERYNRPLAALTLGIYLIHPIFLETFNFLGYGAMAFHPLLSIPVITLVIFVLSAGIAWLMGQIPYVKRVI
ncbi:MAG: acyltransferase family protein [Spirulina sp. SIO3F2]|nr:acyltransferase family protein [Spirulina sp. SIO3F2]